LLNTSRRSRRGDKFKLASPCSERLPREAASLVADIQKINAAPHPSALRKEAAKQEITALAERGKIGALASVDHGAPLQWPTASADLWAHGLPAGVFWMELF
jgi:hypothetical protein